MRNAGDVVAGHQDFEAIGFVRPVFDSFCERFTLAPAVNKERAVFQPSVA
jgi:hypothetical protein